MSELLSSGEIRRLLQENTLRPTKGLGQNFVVDSGTVRRIAAAVILKPGEWVLEVGSGMGSLTLALLQAGAKVCAVEIDSRLALLLPEIVARKLSPAHAAESLQVLNQDMLRTRELPVRVESLVANLPYNVAVPIIMHILETFPSVASAVVMVQSEVAERLVALPGSRIYGAPSVKAAWWGKWEIAWRVGNQVFWPVPKVDSAVVRFTRDQKPDSNIRSSLFTLIDKAFLQRRKMLRQSLKEYVDLPTFVRAGINPTLRPEQLSVDDFLSIARVCKISL